MTPARRVWPDCAHRVFASPPTLEQQLVDTSLKKTEASRVKSLYFCPLGAIALVWHLCNVRIITVYMTAPIKS